MMTNRNGSHESAWGKSLQGLKPAVVLAIMLVPAMAGVQLAQAQTFVPIHSFTGPTSDGQAPLAGVVRDGNGTVYGTTYQGGAFYGGGVFRVTKSGSESLLYSFQSSNDGSGPRGGLVRDAATGTLYGTTQSGGNTTNCSGGCGTVFELKPHSSGWQESVIYSFLGGKKDGCFPMGDLFRDKAGNLYGTAGICGTEGFGIVFKLTPKAGGKWKETVLYNFLGGSDGGYATGGVIMDPKGNNLYGVTSQGGTGDCGGYGCGVVYKLSKSGKNYQVLYNFAGGTTDGCLIESTETPAMDSAGNLYGTTDHCGASNYGNVWELIKKDNYAESVLYNFAGGATDGANPYVGVILDAKGNLFGDTTAGGTYNGGTVFSLKPNKGGWTEKVLHSFAVSDGQYPAGVLLLHAGHFYGTAAIAGNSNCTGGCGTVWELTP